MGKKSHKTKQRESNWKHLVSMFFSKNIFGLNKKDFMREILNYFKKGVAITLEKNTLLYIYVHEFVQYSSPIASEIKVVFTVDTEKRFEHKGSLFLNEKKTQNQTYEFHVKEDEEKIGEQIFYYTFFFRVGYKTSIKDFELFVREEYLKKEEIKKENDLYWDLLKNSNIN